MDSQDNTKLKFKLTRRQFLLTAGLSISAAGAYGSIYRWRSTADTKHVLGVVDTSEFDPAVVQSIVTFLGVFYGISLTKADRSELTQRLIFSTRFDSNWRVDYRAFVQMVDDIAQRNEANSFANASVSTQKSIINLVKEVSRNWSRRRMRAFFGLDDTVLIKIQRATVPHLLRLYRMSGVPWRQRGYQSWPGVGGNTFDYTRKLESL
jgi:hypothetical protein